ncbi:MAG TPA: hypothetical protein VIG62_09725 [Blastocatellia bacterium]|jgi:hypothetical protein
MILFCGIASEPPLKSAIDAAEAAGVAYGLFNQRESHYSDLSISITGGSLTGVIRLQEKNFALEEFNGVYIRLMQWEMLPENKPSPGRRPDPQAVERSRLFHEALLDWLEVAPCAVLNKCSAMSSNGSKPYQAQLIARAGFETPVTLVTNDPEEAREFFYTHDRVVYKSISSIRSIVRELRPIDLEQLDKVRYLPTQFQAFVPGTNIRVHVVGERVFATIIETDSADYRYASREGHDVVMRPAGLPEDIESRCVEISKSLDLPLCGIDLKVTPDGRYYCFEVNPSPAYTYYEQYTHQPIAQAIVSHLTGGYSP